MEASRFAQGASWKVQIFPPSYLAPNGYLQQNSVEQQTTELLYKLRGNKIGFWGSDHFVCTPKAMPSYDQGSSKNRRAAKFLSSSE
jgi:hypothetical protein